MYARQTSIKNQDMVKLNMTNKLVKQLSAVSEFDCIIKTETGGISTYFIFSFSSHLTIKHISKLFL